MKRFLERIDHKVRTEFTFWDLALLKTYGALPALVLGAYFPGFVKEYLWIFVPVFTVLLIRYTYILFVKKEVAGAPVTKFGTE